MTELIEIDPDGDLVLVLTSYETENAAPFSCPRCGAPIKGESDYEVHIIKCVSEDTYWEATNDSIENEDLSPREIRVRVSPKHLSLASYVFKTMLSRDWSEGNAFHSHGSMEVSLPEDHPLALLILLYIAHGRTAHVPRILSMDMLMKVALLVDKYQFQVVTRIFSDIWVDNLKELIDEEVTDRLLQWLFISWVFNRKDEFRAVTRTLQRGAVNQLDEYDVCEDLPIPDIIIEKIEESRQVAISAIFELIQRYVVTYTGLKEQCCFDCDAMVLGTLVKNLKILNPHYPDPPPAGHSFNTLYKKARAHNYKTLCNQKGSHGYSQERFRDCVSIKPEFDQHLNTLLKNLNGLDIVEILQATGKGPRGKVAAAFDCCNDEVRRCGRTHDDYRRLLDQEKY